MAGARGRFSRDLPFDGTETLDIPCARTCTHNGRILAMSSAKRVSLGRRSGSSVPLPGNCTKLECGNFYGTRPNCAAVDWAGCRLVLLSSRRQLVQRARECHRPGTCCRPRRNSRLAGVERPLRRVVAARRHTAADHSDTDLHFHREKLESHLGDKLEWLLMGWLFRDNHEAKKDARHAVRGPRSQMTR